MTEPEFMEALGRIRTQMDSLVQFAQGLQDQLMRTQLEHQRLKVRVEGAEKSINEHYSRCPMCVLADVPKLGEES